MLLDLQVFWPIFEHFLTTTPAILKTKLSGLRLPTLKLPEVELRTLRLPILKLPALAAPDEGSQPSTPQGEQSVTPAKESEPLHSARTPLATYARVKSRLQDRPPLVVAFADQVSVLNPSSLMPKQTSDVEVPKGDLCTAWNKLLDNLGDLLPTPLASLIDTSTPRKRFLASILGGHAAKRVSAEVEHDPHDDSMIPQYQKWKKIKNKRLHNAQWSCLIIACILLICAIHIQKLREIKWWKFEFWQWLALGFVGLAGRLISGWGIKVSWHASTYSPSSTYICTSTVFSATILILFARGTRASGRSTRDDVTRAGNPSSGDEFTRARSH